jgi:hypothetical protein
MKTTTTLIKYLTVTLVLCLAFQVSFSQTLSSNTNNSVRNLKAVIAKDNIEINFTVSEGSAADYFEVQVSEDGITFKTIGFVLGTNPTNERNECAYKQKLQKLSSRAMFYRILNTKEGDTKAFASNMVKITK